VIAARSLTVKSRARALRKAPLPRINLVTNGESNGYRCLNFADLPQLH
jgi:hypothetical protein